MAPVRVGLPEQVDAGSSCVSARRAGMIAYYLDQAWRSCLRSKALTALVVALMGCGVATCMVTYAVFRATSADPIPWKSSQLFVPQVDNVGPTNNNGGEPSDLLGATDAMALQHAHRRGGDPFGMIEVPLVTQSMPSFFSL